LCEEARGWGAESDAAALACRAQIAQTEGYLRATESFLEEAKERNPYGVHTATLAGVLVGMHRIDEAVDMVSKRLAINPRDSAAYFQLYRALDARARPGRRWRHCGPPLPSPLVPGATPWRSLWPTSSRNKAVPPKRSGYCAPG
jgi:tetratricopeptide (TPR) repeat protein